MTTVHLTVAEYWTLSFSCHWDPFSLHIQPCSCLSRVVGLWEIKTDSQRMRCNIRARLGPSRTLGPLIHIIRHSIFWIRSICFECFDVMCWFVCMFLWQNHIEFILIHYNSTWHIIMHSANQSRHDSKCPAGGSVQVQSWQYYTILGSSYKYERWPVAPRPVSSTTGLEATTLSEALPLSFVCRDSFVLRVSTV